MPRFVSMPVCFTQDQIRRAAGVLREAQLLGGSVDTYVLAIRVLEAAIRGHRDLMDLLPPTNRNGNTNTVDDMAARIERAVNAA